MRISKRILLVTFLLGMFVLAAFLIEHQSAHEPKYILWAWDVPEDLRFININKFGVAPLVMTIEFEHDHFYFEARHQPIMLPKNVYVLPVIRLEDRDSTFRILTSTELRAASAKISELAGSTGVQIDFDASYSDRNNYARLLHFVHNELGNRPLSMTALASWCIHDTWIDSLPVSKAVPMLFRMGSQSKSVRDYFNYGHSIQAHIASTALGLSTDEPVPNVAMDRQIFLFNPQPWNKKNLHETLENIASRSGE